MTVCTVTVCCYADKMPVKMLLGVLGEATYFPHGWQSQIENEKLWNTSPSTQPHIRLWVSLVTMLEAVGTQHRETEHSYPPGRSGSTLSAHHWSPFLLTIFWLKYSWFTVLCNFCCTAKWFSYTHTHTRTHTHTYIYIHSLLKIIFSTTVYHRMLSVALCAVQ